MILNSFFIVSIFQIFKSIASQQPKILTRQMSRDGGQAVLVEISDLWYELVQDWS